MWKEFKEFIAQDNVINLAIGVILGGAFSKIVSSLVDDIFMPIIVSVTGAVDVSHLAITIGNTKLTYGNFLQAVINFLMIGFMLFLTVKGLQQMNAKRKVQEEVDEATVPTETELLTEILAELKKGH
ncbi:large conductance mechanosensitive channel protein MscL [Dolosicoccus paucivorans]|uniref:Large-conductance mechanosensitive channel n=1 Tax=Dolosicoccus paucivorans TaxID=84521 RepID=A0A1G8KVM5_9LACT|nr:large conductance mechanosensitive channel protein MscL [Dolosicoccus paucivorans]PMB84233.1 large conductance mechanosensitive channel protein MscL [Dolosicoccus paucivorans]PMC58521.1 large conductance mechanosensitive channel protein MscL [Dolosicoccus paucivorans]SDI47494.1 large conductance mechanosensitive channel [Dolosicoccus paucivorans]